MPLVINHFYENRLKNYFVSLLGLCLLFLFGTDKTAATMETYTIACDSDYAPLTMLNARGEAPTVC